MRRERRSRGTRWCGTHEIRIEGRQATPPALLLPRRTLPSLFPSRPPPDPSLPPPPETELAEGEPDLLVLPSEELVPRLLLLVARAKGPEEYAGGKRARLESFVFVDEDEDEDFDEDRDEVGAKVMGIREAGMAWGWTNGSGRLLEGSEDSRRENGRPTPLNTSSGVTPHTRGKNRRKSCREIEMRLFIVEGRGSR